MSVPDGTHDDPGRRITARIQVLARGDVNDPSSQVHNLIGARIVALLDHGHATLDPFVTGATVWMAHHLRSEEHTSELQSLMRTSYAVFCLKKQKLIAN